MKILGIAGWSGSGKTTLLTALIPCLAARGLRVSSIKHAHHTLELDAPGKDSYRHREAGAVETMLAHANGFVLFQDYRGKAPPDLKALLARLAPVDVVLAEGFRDYDFPKIEVYRPALGKPPLWTEMNMVAVASDAAVPECKLPVLNLNAVEQIADFVCLQLGLKPEE